MTHFVASKWRNAKAVPKYVFGRFCMKNLAVSAVFAKFAAIS